MCSHTQDNKYCCEILFLDFSLGICIKSLKIFVFMLETAISLLEFYPKGKKNQRITKELFMRMFIAAYLKCKKKKGRTN